MNPSRIFTLVKKEFLYGSKNFIFVMALVMPVVLTLVISLLVGTLFSGKPRLGILDRGRSQLTVKLDQLDYLTTATYTDEILLHSDVERGALDMGMVLPANFDSQLQAEDATQMDLLIWGESLLKHRTILAVSLVRQIIDVAGREIPVNTQLVLLGEEANIPWDVRLFPFVVIITIMLCGMMVPATSLRYPNVLYCMDNETNDSPEWSAYWADYLHQRAAKVGVKVAFCKHFQASNSPFLAGQILKTKPNHAQSLILIGSSFGTW